MGNYFKYFLLGMLFVGQVVAQNPTPSKSFTIGPATNDNKELRFNRNSTSKPRVRWNESTSKIQFTNDGSNFKDLGSGSGGGGGGTNLLAEDNFDFEAGTSAWTASGGSFTVDSSSPLSGGSSGVFDASALNQTLQSALKSIPAGFAGRKCQIHVPYVQYASGSEGDYVLEVLNQSSVVLATVNVPVTSTNTSSVFQAFDCPITTDQMRASIRATVANPGAIEIDDVFLGQGRNEVQSSQATLFATAQWVATSNCGWSLSAGAYQNFPADTDCPNPTVTGPIQAASTKIPGFVVPVLPRGKYLFVVQGAFTRNGSNSTSAGWRISDGTNHSTGNSIHALSGITSWALGGVTGTIDHPGGTNVTFQIQGAAAGTDTIQIQANAQDLGIQVFRFPDKSLDGNTYETSGWRVDAIISGNGNNVSLGTSSVSSYTEMTDSGLALTNRSGAGIINATIPCSSTNPSTGSTCSSGNEGVGVVFNLPKAGDVRVCGSFNHHVNTAAGGDVDAVFQFVETAANSQTILQEAGGKTESALDVGNSSMTFPHRNCGTLSFSSAGSKTIRLMYEQVTGPTLATNVLRADGSVSYGQRDINITVEPINESMPAPVFNEVREKIKSSSSGVRLEVASLNCDASSSILSQIGSWISTIGNVSVGECTGTFAPGTFTQTPNCLCSWAQSPISVGVVVGCRATSSTAFTIDAEDDAGNSATAYDVNMLCVGL